jgi:purine-nucleoside phosphorylase
MADDIHKQLEETVEPIRHKTNVRPRIALILGSGFGPLADEIGNSNTFSYEELPHFPLSTAPGHAGKLVVGELEGQAVAAMSGRAHLYEGYSPWQVVYPVRLMRHLGAEILIVTNAAGGVNLSFQPGNLMLISDHINLTGLNPLVGPNDRRLGVRFPDMSQAYDPQLKETARQVAQDRDVTLVEGVYLAEVGPTYETPAEIRMVRTLGADAVGMSTVMETIAANHMGMRVLGISCISNMAAGISPHKLTEQEVIETANRVKDTFATLVRGIIGAI